MKYHFEKLDMVMQGIELNIETPKEILQYAVGALLYTPASYPKIVETLLEQTYPDLKSWAFCLEDSLTDQAADQAAEQLIASLKRLADALKNGQCSPDQLPLMFIRVRSAQQMALLFDCLADIDWLLCGFIAPKFERSNMEAYTDVLRQINTHSHHPLYLMPILESPAIIYKESRLTELQAIKKTLDEVQELILNVRVGGNDFCNLFGLRRGVDQEIYQISVIADALGDILNVFGRDHVVSGPVWEYFGAESGAAWQQGLLRELKSDLLNGFIGKTAVHPTQLDPIQRSLVVTEADYLDAQQILNWQDSTLGVRKGVQIERMNEQRVHQQWARKILALAKVYGVKRTSDHE